MRTSGFCVEEFSYDVFISYRRQDPDKSWVRDFLVPRLQAEGISICVDFLSFRLGSSLILEMTEAVERSRYTLAVLSPTYLSSNFTELENIMAEHLSLETNQSRLIVVMHEACTPRLSIRTRLWLDMMDESQSESNIVRLADLLRSF